MITSVRSSLRQQPLRHNRALGLLVREVNTNSARAHVMRAAEDDRAGFPRELAKAKCQETAGARPKAPAFPSQKAQN